MPLSDYVQRATHEDTFRLTNISLWIPSDEQTAKARAKNPDIPVRVSMKVEWEPLSYRKFIGEDEIKAETDYIPVTKSRGLANNEAVLVEQIRSGGFPAIPADARVGVPDPKRADEAKQTQPFPRFYVAAAKAGIVIDVDENGAKTGQPGQLFTTSVGKIYVCRNGAEQFPTVNEGATGNDFWNWQDTRSVFMRVPVREVTDFVQPDTIPERRYERKEGSDEGGGTPGATTTVAPSANVDSQSLKEAVAMLGIEGKTVSVVNASAVAVVTSNIAKSPAVLGAGEVNQAALSGNFVNYLVAKGVVDVTDGKVVLVA